MERTIPKRRTLYWVAVISCLLSAPFHCPTVTGAEAPTRAEAESVKAVMTSIILRSTQWPDSAFAEDSRSFKIGIIGRNPPVKEFNAAFEGIPVSGRTVTVVSLKTPDDAVGLQAVYFSEASTELIEHTLKLLAGTPTLSFGDHEDFFKLGGIVNYRTVSGKLRFEFNRKSMEQSGTKVSAQVIRLALPTQEKEAEK